MAAGTYYLKVLTHTNSFVASKFTATVEVTTQSGRRLSSRRFLSCGPGATLPWRGFYAGYVAGYNEASMPSRRISVPETVVTLTVRNQMLRGVLHTPEGAGSAPAVLWLHGLFGHRIEAHRLFVEGARRLAERGIASLRFDFCGSARATGSWSMPRLPRAWKTPGTPSPSCASKRGWTPTASRCWVLASNT